MEISALRSPSRSHAHSGLVLVLLVAACGIARSVDENGDPIPLQAVSTYGTTDSMGWHRYYLANDDKTPSETLAVLGHDKNREIRERVIFNKNTDLMTIMSLQDDTTTTESKTSRFKTVGGEAIFVYLRRTNYENAHWFLHDRDPQIRVEVASGVSNELLLYSLSNDSDVNVRAEVASNTHTPAYVLDALGSDTSSWVRSQLPEFWQYWTALNDSKGKFLIYASRRTTSKMDASGYKTHTIWLNFSKDSKAHTKQEPKQYDLYCFDNRYGITGTNKTSAAIPGSQWFKIIRAVCTNYKTTATNE